MASRRTDTAQEVKARLEEAFGRDSGARPAAGDARHSPGGPPEDAGETPALRLLSLMPPIPTVIQHSKRHFLAKLLLMAPAMKRRARQPEETPSRGRKMTTKTATETKRRVTETSSPINDSSQAAFRPPTAAENNALARRFVFSRVCELAEYAAAGGDEDARQGEGEGDRERRKLGSRRRKRVGSRRKKTRMSREDLEADQGVRSEGMVYDGGPDMIVPSAPS